MDPVLLLALGLFNYIQIMPFRSDLVSVTPIRLYFRAKIFVRTPVSSLSMLVEDIFCGSGKLVV